MPVTVAVAVAAEGSGPTVPLTAQGNGSSSINKPHYAEPTVAEGLHADNSGLLFKKVTPRRRKDQFGRESTRHADYLLSMAVFPTGVRAPLLSELQKKSEHQWGFEIFDKGTKPASPVSHVHIRDSKSAPDSSCCRQGSAAESAKKPPPNTPLKGSLKLTSDRGAFHHQSQSFSCSSPTRAKCRWVHSITEAAGPTGVGLGGQKKVKDIRDPLYINTYCQGERKLRYKKSTLPLSTRARPWTVSEPNPSYRFKRQSKEVPSSEKPRGRPGRPEWADQGLDFRINARDVMARTKGSTAGGAQDDEDPEESEVTASMKGNQALMMVKSYFPGTGGDITLGDQREKLRGKQGCLHAKVKQCIKFVMFREKLSRNLSVERPLKAEHGRYRPFSTTTIRTPRSTNPSTTSQASRHPNPISVEVLKEYIDTIALQTRLALAADKRRKPRPAASGLLRNNTAASSYQDSALQSVTDFNRPFSEAINFMEKASKPSEGGQAGSLQLPFSAAASDRDGETDSGRAACRDPGLDPGRIHVLDIIRLSPKAHPSRSSRVSRDRSTHREGGGEERRIRVEKEEKRGNKNTHAIFLPNVTRSATTSVCSFADEIGNTAEI